MAGKLRRLAALGITSLGFLILGGCGAPTDAALPITGSSDPTSSSSIPTSAPPTEAPVSAAVTGVKDEGSEWLDTDGNGLCPEQRVVTGAGLFNHPTFGLVTLAVCSGSPYAIGDNGEQIPVAVGLISGDGEVIWQLNSNYALFMSLPEVFIDSTGNLFVMYSTGGTWGKTGVLVLRPTNDGLVTIPGDTIATEVPETSWDANVVEGEGEWPALFINDDGEFTIGLARKYHYRGPDEISYQDVYQWNQETEKYELLDTQSCPTWRPDNTLNDCDQEPLNQKYGWQETPWPS